MFHDDHPPSKIGSEFPFASGGRGLPVCRELSNDPIMTAMFRLLLRDGQIFEDDHPEFGDAIQKAHKKGYIYAKELSQVKRGFVLPTPIHTTALSWVLIPSEVNLPSNLLDLVLEVVGRFKYSQLTHPLRRAGGDANATSGPPEAQYQDEFYRALHDYTKGGVRVSPEFATAPHASKAGRIDFFIANNKWGIEITQEGKKLQEHSDRFGDHGAYGHWVTTGEMLDYILLDCRHTVPVKHHSCWSSLSFFIEGTNIIYRYSELVLCSLSYRLCDCL